MDDRKWLAFRVKDTLLSYKEMKWNKKECFMVDENADRLLIPAFNCYVHAEKYQIVFYTRKRKEGRKELDLEKLLSSKG